MKQSNQTSTKWYTQPRFYIVGTLGLVLLVALSWWGISSYLQNRPQVIMADALSNSITSVTDTAPLQRDITVMYQPSEAQKGIPITLNLSGISQDGSYSAQAQLSTSILGQDVTLGGNFIAVDSEYYLQLTDVEKSLQAAAGSNPLLTVYVSYATEVAKKYEGVWINVTPEKTSEGVSSACTEALSNVVLTEGDKNKMKELYTKNPLFTDVKKVGTEPVNNQPSYHLQASVSESTYRVFKKEVSQLSSLSGAASACGDEPLSPASSPEGVIDVWVSKSTRVFTKLQHTQKQGTTSVELSSSPTSTIPGTINKPESSVTLEQFKTDLEAVIGTVL